MNIRDMVRDNVQVPVMGEGTRLAIIGAGSAGVYAAKEALDSGWEPTLFERSSQLGGVWRPGNHWDSLTTNSSFEMMSRGDFPFPFKPSSDFPSRLEICKYIETFASHFGLHKYIKFATTVTLVEPISPSDSRSAWKVVTKSTNSAEIFSTFDAVFVASGQFSIPRMPQALLRDNKGFTGTISHSHNFRDGADFAGQRVLVVGIGNSALDVALECAQRGAASVVVACRRGSILLPIMSDTAKALDKMIASRFFEAQPSAVKAYRLMSEAVAVTKEFVSAGMPAPDLSGNPLHQRISNLKQKRQWLEMLHAEPKVLRMHGSGLQSCGPGRRVGFFDSSEMQVDAIVACTGYQVEFPFLQPAPGRADELLEPVAFEYEVPDERGNGNANAPAVQVRALALHRRVMHPRYPTLNFLTQVTCFGNEAIVGGLQARWAISTLSRHGDSESSSGSGRLEMAVLRASCDAIRARFKRQRPLFPNFVNYSRYADELASDIGCMPPSTSSLSTWFSDPRLAYGLLFGPQVEAHYNLGEGAGKQARQLARDLIVGVGVARL